MLRTQLVCEGYTVAIAAGDGAGGGWVEVATLMLMGFVASKNKPRETC